MTATDNKQGRAFDTPVTNYTNNPNTPYDSDYENLRNEYNDWKSHNLRYLAPAKYSATNNAYVMKLMALKAKKDAYAKNTKQATLSSTQTQADQALRSGQANAQQEAKANAAANANAGINKSAAGLLGSQASSTDSANTANNLYAANINTQASTQADYLQKMAQADALDQQAKNVKKSGDLAAMGAFFGGSASGASVGQALANTSDENEKQAPGIDEAKLFEQIRQFKKLYKELQELKGSTR